MFHTKLRTRVRGQSMTYKDFPEFANGVTYINKRNGVFLSQVGPIYGPLYPVATQVSNESITDEILDFSEYSAQQRQLIQTDFKKPTSAWRKQFKYCNHTRYAFTTPTLPAPFTFQNEIYTNVYWGRSTECYILEGSILNHSLANYDGNFDPFGVIQRNEAFKVATGISTPQLQQFLTAAQDDAALLASKSFSVANFIAELKDVKNLVGLLKFDLSKPITSVAESNLLLNFGLFPFIDDLIAIIDIVSNLDKRIDKWNKMASEHVLMNQHKSHMTPDDQTTKVSFTDTFTHGHGTYAVDVKHKTTYSLYYYANPIPLIMRDNLARALMGLDNIGAIVWEALPWSFLIDYVFNIGDIIEDWTNADPILSVTINQAGYSRKMQATMTQDVFLDIVSTDTYLDREPRLSYARTGEISQYLREPFDAAVISSLPERSVGEWQLKDFGIYKASIVASLAVVVKK